MDHIHVSVTVNGRLWNLDVPTHYRLIDLLRSRLAFTGTKEGCGKGECGTCSVLLDGRLVSACLVLAGQVHGHDVITIEGLAGDDTFKTLQQAFLDHGAVQCGFCTPGMLLASYTLLRGNPDPGIEEIQAAISGNICRCTGYTKIIEAVQAAAAMLPVSG